MTRFHVGQYGTVQPLLNGRTGERNDQAIGAEERSKALHRIDRKDARTLQRPRGINASNFGVSVRAPDEGRRRHVLELNIGDESATPTNKHIVLDAQDPVAA